MQHDIVRRAWTELEPEIASQGFELVEVELGQQGATPILRLYVDHKDGVTLDRCADLSRHLSAYLDVIDFLSERYSLEESSPGIDRPVRKQQDFERFEGEAVKLRTVAPVDGRRRFKGTIQGFADGMVTIETDGRRTQIHLENIQKAQLDR